MAKKQPAAPAVADKSDPEFDRAALDAENEELLANASTQDMRAAGCSNGMQRDDMIKRLRALKGL
jgi:hypothetical protein